MNVWLVYGVAEDIASDEALLRVCDSKDAAREWAQLYLNTSQWASVFIQCWKMSSMPEK